MPIDRSVIRVLGHEIVFVYFRRLDPLPSLSGATLTEQ